MSKPKYNSAVFRYVSIVIKRILELEYRIRAVKQYNFEIYNFLINFRIRIEEHFLNSGLTLHDLKNLKLVDAIFDYIQFDIHHFAMDYFVEYGLNPEDMLINIQELKHQFDNCVKNFDTYQFNQIHANYRFADVSDGNDIEAVIRAYMEASSMFDYFEQFNKTRTPQDSKKLLKEQIEINKKFIEFRLPSQRSVKTSFIEHKVLHFPDLKDEYLTLNLRAFEDPESIPYALTNFLMEYVSYRTTYFGMDDLKRQDKDAKIARAEIEKVVELVKIIDGFYIKESDFRLYRSHLPNLLGIYQWDLRKKGQKAGSAKNEIQELIDDLTKNYPENKVTIPDESTMSKQFDTTEEKINDEVENIALL